MSFKYFKWNAKKEKEYRYDGESIVVSPACLMWFDENYYLVAYSEKRDSIRYYRVDKMDSVVEIDEAREGIADIDRKKIAAIARNSFGMYQGETRTVNIVCDSSIVGIFIDRFGYDIDITQKGDKAKLRIELEVSPQFFGWLSGLGNKAYIEGPKDIKSEYVSFVKDILKNY